jgi:hypothetical protein
MRQLPSQNYISHHLGGYSLNWPKISQSEGLGLSSSLQCSSLEQNTQKHTLAAKSLKVTTRIHFLTTQKLLHFDLRSTQAHTRYSQGMLRVL